MILTVIGTRPQFIKAAMVSGSLQRAGITEKIVHTGQHYDPEMSEIFWAELNLPPAHINLECGSNEDGMQTERIAESLKPVIDSIRPEYIMVYGDTNSALAGAWAARDGGIPLIHVEAGLRSFNMDMPEERNRISIDQLSYLLFCSSTTGRENLQREGITGKIIISGDVMHDAFILMKNYVEKHIELKDVLPFDPQPYLLVTVHRPSNADHPEKMRSLLKTFGEAGFPVIWPVHPRNNRMLFSAELPKNIFLVPPLGYVHMQAVLHGAYKICTDSGGLQKEAYWANKPCITLREETEWIETLEADRNILCGTDRDRILTAINKRIDVHEWPDLYGQNASDIIAEAILRLK